LIVLNASKGHLTEKVRTPHLNTDVVIILGGTMPELYTFKEVVKKSLKQYPKAK
jgi:hypothetical protein